MPNEQKHLTLQQRWPTNTGYGLMNKPWPTSLTYKSLYHDKGIGKRFGSLLPACLKAGMEVVSGVSLQRVRVFYNSPLPAQVNAHAYAQGYNIYLAPGQEHHLPHELGHVVQQIKGMVQPTATVNGVPVNDDPRLESHATELGEQAMKYGR